MVLGCHQAKGPARYSRVECPEGGPVFRGCQENSGYLGGGAGNGGGHSLSVQ